MPVFTYQAFNDKGKKVSGQFEANSPMDVRDQLRAQGLLAYKIERASNISLLDKLVAIFEGSVSDKLKIQFTNQLSILLKAGVPLLDAMNLLIEQFSGKFRKVIGLIIDDIREGTSLASAMEKYPSIFSKIQTQLVRAGEASGSLEVVLDRMTTFLERSEEVSKAVSSAMRKPILMISLVIAVFLGAVLVLIPAVGKTLSQVGRTLPGLTQMMMDLGDFIFDYWFLAGAVVIAIIISFLVWKSSESGRLQFHSLLLKIPKVNTLVKSQAVVQFSQTLGMLLEAGVNLPEALDIVNNVVENRILSQALKKAREEIIKEGKIAKHLKNTKIFPAVSDYMIKTGEESGELAKMLIKVGKDSEVELLDSVNNLVASIDPIMMFLIAGVVLFIVMAIFLPIMEMSNMDSM